MGRLVPSSKGPKQPTSVLAQILGVGREIITGQLLEPRIEQAVLFQQVAVVDGERVAVAKVAVQLRLDVPELDDRHLGRQDGSAPRVRE